MAAANEAPASEDQNLTETYVAVVFNELDKFGTPDFTVNAIPDWAQEAMRDRVAHAVANEFGFPPARMAELAARSAEGLLILLRHTQALAETNTRLELRNSTLTMLGLIRQGETPPGAMSEACLDVIDSLFEWLDQRGTIGFTSTTIPTWSRSWLRDMAAYRAAPEFGIVDPNVIKGLAGNAALAEAEILKRFTALAEGSTKNYLRNRILMHLGIVGVSEEATSGQKELVEDAIDEVFSELTIHGIITYSTSTIPDWAMHSLRNYIAYRVAPSLGVNPQPLLTDHIQGKNELYKQHRTKKTDEPVRARYY